MGIRKIESNKTAPWEVSYGQVNGKRKRRYFETRKKAEKSLKAFEEERDRLGNVWLQLPVQKRADTVKILREVEAAGTNLEEVWEFWKGSHEKRTGKSLGAVYDEFLESRAGAGLSDLYLDQLRIYIRNFILDREDDDVSDVTPAEIDKWLAARKESPSTRQTGINRLSALFSFCVRRGYLRDNPVKRVERVRVPHGKRGILSNAECRKLVVKALETDRGLLTYLGLALFCGIRPDEAKRITRKEIDLERGIVTLEAEKSKVRDWRFVTLTEPAKHCLRAGERFKPTNFRKRFEALRKAAKIKAWPHDVLRKTAASHFYNLYGIDKATEQLGHSANVMLRVYRNLVTEKQTAEWLEITPVELKVVEGGGKLA